MKQKLLLASLFGLFAYLLIHPLFPGCHFFAFSPLVVFYLIHTPLITTLWASVGLGLLADIVSSSHMGVNALNFFLTSFLLYRQRKHFIKDNPYNLSLFTSLYSIVWTILYAVLIFLFDRRILIHGKWLITDLFIMPALDGLYAYICFTLPFALLDKMRARKKKNESEESNN